MEKIATEKGVTPAQLAIAWVLAQGDDLARIDADLPPPVGDSYDEAGMASVDR